MCAKDRPMGPFPFGKAECNTAEEQGNDRTAGGPMDKASAIHWSGRGFNPTSSQNFLHLVLPILLLISFTLAK